MAHRASATEGHSAASFERSGAPPERAGMPSGRTGSVFERVKTLAGRAGMPAERAETLPERAGALPARLLLDVPRPPGARCAVTGAAARAFSFSALVRLQVARTVLIGTGQ